MEDRRIEIERAQNLWESFSRKFDPVARSAQLRAEPNTSFSEIGGLAGPKEEVLTYACAATSPDVYGHWGTFPPSAILMIGRRGTGKNLLAQALATQTQTSFVLVDVPRLVLDIVHAGGKVGELIQGWSQVLEEMPKLTIFFDELEFSQAQEIGSRRADLPIGPIMDFLLELVDRSVAAPGHLVVGATSDPDTLRHAFLTPGRFERVVEVTPAFPDDQIETLQIHAASAEKRAGRPLFDDVEWIEVVGQTRTASPGDWVRILHAVLRRKARCEAGGEDVTPVTTDDLKREVDVFQQTALQIHTSGGGNYV